MQTTLDIQKRLDAFLDGLPSDIKTAAARFVLEFRTNPDVFAGMGLSESEYVQSRLVDEGLAELPRGKAPKNDERPAHVRNPMMAMNPKGNECGSPDPMTID